MFEIILIADKCNGYIAWSKFAQLPQPAVDVRERVAVGDVVHHNGEHRASIVRVRNCSETLLTSFKTLVIINEITDISCRWYLCPKFAP